jgi:arylsulfatase A-like enzyme
MLHSLLALLLAVAGPAEGAGPRLAERVIIISLDGFPAHEFEAHRASLPNLDALAKAGVHGRSLTVAPSVTWPAHTSLITGTLPARHGVVGNRWLDRTRWKVAHAWKQPKEDSVRVRTLYDVAKAAGLRTAGLLWPHTRGAPGLDLNIPEVFSKADFKRFVTPSLAKSLRAAGVAVDDLAKFSSTEDVLLDGTISSAAEVVIAKHDPHLLLLHFCTADSWGHRFGPETDVYRRGLGFYDSYVGRVIAAVEKSGRRDQTAIFVVSDHGFFVTTHQVDAEKLLVRAGLPTKSVRIVSNGHLAYVYVAEGPGRAALIAKARKALEGEPKIERVLAPEEFAAIGLPLPTDNPAVGDLVVLSRTDGRFGKIPGKAIVGRPKYKGTHGHLPEAGPNRPLFIASGAGIRARAAGIEMRNIDVAPTAARLLGLALPQPLDGAVRSDFLP